ncbi:hypothetical protein ABZ897_29610 [Nonomuraea sp. NPDC046802]|uniref:hypothetical protein n=1 Tax=Nonomuraea sp. NPDC046802 TaxID=3154919 RepID=UPI0033C0BEE1
MTPTENEQPSYGELVALVGALTARLDAPEAENTQLKAEIAELREENADLRRQLGRNSLFCLVTRILDVRDGPAATLAGIYHQRREHETRNDQIKTHLRGPGRVLRSKESNMALAEIYGYLLTHYALSALICETATEA